MVKQNTVDDVYGSLMFFIFGGIHDNRNIKEIPALKQFVIKLFDLNNLSVEPFNEYETDRIRFLYGINWENIIIKYEEKNIDVTTTEVDFVEYSNRLHQYIMPQFRGRN